MNKNYIFTGALKVRDGVTLKQIECEKYGVGGWIESESNLSQEGDCWVYDDAVVYGKAKVSGNAQVCENAKVYGKADVSGNAEVYGKAKVHGKARCMVMQ